MHPHIRNPKPDIRNRLWPVLVLLGTVLSCSPFSARTATPGEVRIFEVQGDGKTSPMVDQETRTAGVVTGILTNGFFIQDPEGDANVGTSDGLFVYRPKSSEASLPSLGDLVVVDGTVKEYYGLTELVLGTVTVRSSDNPLPPPVALAEAMESIEGMRASVSDRVRVVGPTKRYAATDEFYVMAEEALPFGRVFEGSTESVGAPTGVLSSSGLLPDVKAGDLITGITGPLHYSYGNYKVASEGMLRILPAPDTSPALSEVHPPAFGVATFNMENLFDTENDPRTSDPVLTQAEYDHKLTKLARAVRDGLRAPTVLAVQEVEHRSVLHDLSAHPDLRPFRYEPILLEGLDPRGIDVGMLVRSDRVAVVDLDGDGDGGVSSSRSEDKLFSRPPLAVEMKIDGTFPLVVIVNHFKSKRGGDARTAVRRMAQARYVAELVEDIRARDPEAHVIVLGDLNDTPDSDPLRVLTEEGALRNLVSDEVPKPERYSYIHYGRAQVLDHILITPSLNPWLVRVEIAHLNADFPDGAAADTSYYRCSDHDPVRAVFRQSVEH